MKIVNDQDKAVDLFTEHDYLVKYKAYCFRNNNIETEELEGIARVGLWKASLTFEEAKGKFAGYAGRAIDNEINMFLRGEKRQKRYHTQPIRLDQNVDKDGNKINYHDLIGKVSIEYNRFDDKEEANYIIEQYKNRYQHQKHKMLNFEITIKNIYEQKSQLELMEMYGIDQSYISRMIKQCLRDLRSIAEDNKGECI